MNILVAPATTGIGKEIAKSLRHAKNIDLFACGFDKLSAEKEGFLNFTYIGPNQTPETLSSSLVQIIRQNGIEAVYIAHDQWMRDLLSIQIPRFLRSMIVNLPDSQSLRLLSKEETYRSFPIPNLVPRTYGVNAARDHLPVFVKPDIGQGSRRTILIENQQEFSSFVDKFESKATLGYVISEYLPGPEYTVDCFSTEDSKVIYCQGRIRSKTINGISVETWRVDIPNVQEWSQKISSQYLLTGSWFFQLKESASGDLKLLEVGLRIAGASGINRLYGVNLSLMDLYQHQGKSISVLNQDYVVMFCQTERPSVIRKKITRSYFDFDDTLVTDNQVNDKILSAIFNLNERGISVKVLTRNTSDLTEMLKSLNLDSVVDEVIQVPAMDKKSNYIQSKEPFLFVDDSYRERLDVHNHFSKLGVVLDPSAFENQLIFETQFNS